MRCILNCDCVSFYLCCINKTYDFVCFLTPYMMQKLVVKNEDSITTTCLVYITQLTCYMFCYV